MTCHVVHTTNPDLASALDGLQARLKDGLGGERPDLVVAFFTPHHSGDVELLHEKLLEGLDPRVLMGCPAMGVIGEHAETEGHAGLTLWAAHWPGAQLTPFHLEPHDLEEQPHLSGWPEGLGDDVGFLLLVDPYTTPHNALLNGFAERHPGAVVVGGMASGAPGPSDGQLITRDGILDEGAIGLAVGGAVRIDPVVSQGCRPVGHHYVITRAERNVIFELGGKPALEQLTTLANEVDNVDRGLIQTALHLGRVVDERKSTFEPGDFIVRNVMAVDPKTKAIHIGDIVRPGQTIQFMVRDARAASDELTSLLAAEEGKDDPMGALLFSCNGRGSRFFGKANHDIEGLHAGVGDIPTAGFFAAGEIGPVGGVPFLHGLTASIALFRDRDA